MSVQRAFSPAASAPSLLFRFASSQTASSLRPCPHILRSFSSSQSCQQSAKRKMQTQTAYQPTNTTYQPYTFGPSTLNPPPSSRNTGIPETSIAGPVPSIPRAEPTSSLPEQEAQHTRTVPVKPKRPSLLRARKAAMKLTPSAVRQLQLLSTSSEAGRTIKVGVKQKGCSGLQYDLEYVDKPGMLDEVVEQDGVKVIIDSKALMSIIGSQMDWVEDRLNQKFVFSNPNIKAQCGCGESFMVE